MDDYHRKPHAGLMWRTPQQAWDEGVATHRPQMLSEREMRLAFGDRLTRKVGRGGIGIFPVRYDDDAFGKLRLTQPLRNVEIAFWQGSVGAIEVRVDRDRWQTVTATDRHWIGKDFSNMLAVREAKRLALLTQDAVRNAFTLNADAESYRLKALLGIAAPSFSKADIETGADDFIRFADNAGRDWLRTDPLDLFEGEVTASDADPGSDPDVAAPCTDAAEPDTGVPSDFAETLAMPPRIDPSDLME